MKKQMINFVFILFLIGSFTNVLGSIKEITRMEDILKEIDDNTLVLFDIDDTLMISSSTLGSTKWWGYFMRKFREEGLSQNTVVQNRIYPMIQKILREIPSKPVEVVTPAIIQHLQSLNIPVFGFTARVKSAPYDENFGQITSHHLKNIGIHFENTPVNQKDVKLSLIFSDGIIFSHQQPKGPYLLEFLRLTGLHPLKIVFVDDMYYQLHSVEQSLQSTGIVFSGFCYRGADGAGQEFDPLIGNIQMDALFNKGKILSDEQAAKEAETTLFSSPDFYLDDLISDISSLL